MHIVILDAEVLEPASQLEIFRKLGSFEAHRHVLQKDAYRIVKNADVIIVNKVIFDAALLSQLPKLRLICIVGTGANHIDLNAAKKHEIAVYNVAGYSTESVAQHSFAMLFHLLERLSVCDTYVKEGHYVAGTHFIHLRHKFWEIHGKHWGIIGLGNIGRRVAAIAHSFGSHVAYTSTSGIAREEAYPSLSLSALLTKSDIVSIHAPLSSRTQGLIGTEELSVMKPSAILLNLGRGGIVDESALASALDKGLIAAAGLDVLQPEPMQKGNPLLRLRHPERILITPHIAWGSVEARARLLQELAKNIERFIAKDTTNRIA